MRVVRCHDGHRSWHMMRIRCKTTRRSVSEVRSAQTHIVTAYPCECCEVVIPSECLLDVGSAVQAQRQRDGGKSNEERVDTQNLGPTPVGLDRHRG